METKELLNRTMQCQACGGKGVIKTEDKGSTAPQVEEEICKICGGTGIVMDNFITDLMIKNGIRGKAMVEFAEVVYKHYEKKIQDSYNRGIADGESQIKDDKSKTVNIEKK